MAARSLYSLLCANLSLSDDPTYTRFRPPYVTDQPKYAGVPQRQRFALPLRAQRNFPELSSGTFADVPTTRITGSADRPAHQPPLRTCAPPCAPAPNLPCAPAHRPANLRPTSLRTCAAQLPALALRIPQTLSPRTALRRCAEPPAHLHPTSLRTCTQLPCAPAPNFPAHLRLTLRTCA
ncbi:hypothetical protein C8J57DRAFT_1533087 [Mycena rebaudengoi]|nr:hypothetical protein C8J57DRAFT_1533087 [Mycena rebaudengoi]